MSTRALAVKGTTCVWRYEHKFLGLKKARNQRQSNRVSTKESPSPGAVRVALVAGIQHPNGSYQIKDWIENSDLGVNKVRGEALERPRAARLVAYQNNQPDCFVA